MTYACCAKKLMRNFVSLTIDMTSRHTSVEALREINTFESLLRAIVKSGVWEIMRHSAADLAPRVLHP